MQPNSRHQRVKTQTLQLSPQRRFSPGELLSTLSHARSPPPPPPPTDSQTNTHDRILHYSRVDYPTHGKSVWFGISPHPSRRRRNPFFFFFPSAGLVSSRDLFFSWALSLRCSTKQEFICRISPDVFYAYAKIWHDFSGPARWALPAHRNCCKKKKKDEWANVYPHSHIVQEVSNISIHIESCHSSLKECKVMYSVQVLVSSDCLISACLTFKGCHTGNLSLRMLSAFLKVWTTASLHWWASHRWVELGAISGRVCADRF